MRAVCAAYVNQSVCFFNFVISNGKNERKYLIEQCRVFLLKPPIIWPLES